MTSALTDHLGYWLRRVSNHVSHAFARKLDAAGVSVAEWVMLRELFDVEAMAPSLLAGRMGMTRGAISKLADRLLARGLLIRTANPDDGRGHSLSLSPEGRRLTPRLAALADANDAETFDCLSPDERATLAALLRAIAERRNLTSPPLD